MTKRCLRYLTIARRLAVGAALFTFGCGGESNVLTRHDGDGSGGTADVDGGGAGGRGSERGGHGAGGSAGSDGNDKDGSSSSALGSDGGDSEGTGGADNGSGGTASAGVDAATVDPHATERATIVSNFCALLDQYPCLTYPGPNFPPQTLSGAAAAAFCNQSEQVDEWLGDDPCFSEWAAEIKCMTAVPRMCPCTDGACSLWLNETPDPCASQNASVSACLERMETPVHQTTGAVGTCQWQIVANQCRVDCYSSTLGTKDNPVSFNAECKGPPNGPQNCTCSRNGVQLEDGVPFNSNFLYGNDCADVSQQVSDGRCEDVLNCCFTYMTIAEPGHPSVEQCACVSAPMNIGVSSCEAAAAQGGGKVVNICPQYASSNEVPF